MLTDIQAVIWKEWRELLSQYRGDRANWFWLPVLMIVFGVVMPLQAGPDWVAQGMSIGLWVICPFILLSRTMPDAFAGERERHTLETLLASRLPDSALLYGKMVVPLLHGWLITQAVMFLSLVPVNIAFGEGTLLFFKPHILLAGMCFSLLIAAFTTLAGVLVSLRAGTVQQAQQMMSMALFVLLILPSLGMPLLVNLLPRESVEQILESIRSGSLLVPALAAAGFLLVVNGVLLVLCKARFQRQKLILD